VQEREFAEYFLVGSLCNVLVALCAGDIMGYPTGASQPTIGKSHRQAAWEARADDNQPPMSADSCLYVPWMVHYTK